jgi:hypothetical protein
MGLNERRTTERSIEKTNRTDAKPLFSQLAQRAGMRMVSFIPGSARYCTGVAGEEKTPQDTGCLGNSGNAESGAQIARDKKEARYSTVTCQSDGGRGTGSMYVTSEAMEEGIVKIGGHTEVQTSIVQTRYTSDLFSVHISVRVR